MYFISWTEVASIRLLICVQSKRMKKCMLTVAASKVLPLCVSRVCFIVRQVGSCELKGGKKVLTNTVEVLKCRESNRYAIDSV